MTPPNQLKRMMAKHGMPIAGVGNISTPGAWKW
jgi:hypothetical protein